MRRATRSLGSPRSAPRLRALPSLCGCGRGTLCPLLWPFPRAPGACTPEHPLRGTRNTAPHSTAAQNPTHSWKRKRPAPGPRFPQTPRTSAFLSSELSDSLCSPTFCLWTRLSKSPRSILSGGRLTPWVPERPLSDRAPRERAVLGSVAADRAPPGLEGPLASPKSSYFPWGRPPRTRGLRLVGRWVNVTKDTWELWWRFGEAQT